MTKLILAAAAVSFLAFPAFAQSNCAPREMVVARLATGYGETRQGLGLGSGGQVVEIYASLDTGTWTITVTLPSGMTCLVASGEGYENLSEALPPNL